jgi:hypothetical protein
LPRERFPNQSSKAVHEGVPVRELHTQGSSVCNSRTKFESCTPRGKGNAGPYGPAFPLPSGSTCLVSLRETQSNSMPSMSCPGSTNPYVRPSPSACLDASLLPSFVQRNSKELAAMQTVPRFRILVLLSSFLSVLCFLYVLAERKC